MRHSFPSGSRFPRLNRRGLIEARVDNDQRAVHLEFPRLNRRGLIEALCRFGPHLVFFPNFRALTGAASLKPPVLGAGFGPAPYFRALTGAASLKHPTCCCAGALDQKFPRLNRRGLIEASRLFWARTTRSKFPRLNRRGPIEACHTRRAKECLYEISAP